MEQYKSICKILLTSAIALALMHSARAQSNSTPVPAQIVTSQDQVLTNPAQKKFSLTAILTNETDLEESSSAEDTSAATLEVLPSYRISSRASAAVLLAAQHSSNGLEETKLLNTTLYINRDAIALNPDTDLLLSLQGLLPTEEKAREKSSLRGAAGGIARVAYRFSSFKRPSSVSYALNTFKYSHEFDRSTERAANISYRFRHIATYGIELNTKLSVSLSGYFQSGFTYDNVAKELFYLEQSASYSLDSRLSVALSHNTSGAAFEKNGKDWNVEAYDNRNSSVAASLTYVY